MAKILVKLRELFLKKINTIKTTGFTSEAGFNKPDPDWTRLSNTEADLID